MKKNAKIDTVNPSLALSSVFFQSKYVPCMFFIGVDNLLNGVTKFYTMPYIQTFLFDLAKKESPNHHALCCHLFYTDQMEFQP